MMKKMASSIRSLTVFTRTQGGRITIDIVDAGYVALTPWFLVIWNVGCQYDNFNMPDNCRWAMSTLGRGH